MRDTVHINLEDVCLLLEDGPHSMGQLATWLSVSVPTVKSALVRLGRAGRVQCVGEQRLWALAPPRPVASAAAAPMSSPEPPARRPDPSQAQEVRLQPASDADDADPPVGDDDLEPDSDAALVDEFLAPARRGPGRPKPLRQSSPEQKVTRGDAWWVGLPRDVLSATAAAKAPSMSASQHGRSISPVRGISR